MFFDVDVPCWEMEMGTFGPHGPCLDNVECSDTECVGQPEHLPEVKPTDIPEPVESEPSPVQKVIPAPKKAIPAPKKVVTPAPAPAPKAVAPEPVVIFLGALAFYIA